MDSAVGVVAERSIELELGCFYRSRCSKVRGITAFQVLSRRYWSSDCYTYMTMRYRSFRKLSRFRQCTGTSRFLSPKNTRIQL